VIETTTTANGETIRTMTPMEYVKLREAEEAHQKHILDLHHFVSFMSGELQGGALSKLTPEGTDRLIAAYLGRAW